jgi:integrase
MSDARWGDPREFDARDPDSERPRVGELLGLRWSDVDLDADALAVRQALQRIGSELRFVEPKSERSRRCVQLSNSPSTP